MTNRNYITFALLLVFSWNDVFAQPFIDEISNFKVKDAIAFPKEKSTLFVGSSSFRLWKNIESYFPEREIINRGFGGSTLLDLIRYENEIIFPYNPSCILIYCGENDIANANDVDGKMVFERFNKLYSDIRAKFANIPVIYISMKPSPARWHLQDRYLEGNNLIAEHYNQDKKFYYADVWQAMLDENDQPNKSLFVEDMLHMNNRGYEIWGEIINGTLAIIDKK